MGSLLERLRFRAEWLGLKAVIVLVRLLPLDTASALSGRIWRAVAPFNQRHRRAIANLRAAFPEKSEKECDRIARAMWENLGQVMAETLQLDRLARLPERFVYDTAEAKDAIGTGGSVVVTLHSGNWELSALAALEAGHGPAGVYQALRNPLSDAELHRLRSPLYPAGLLPKGHETARRLLSAAKSGGMAAFVGDLRDVRGIRVPFFGRPAWANPFPASVARSARVPLIACRVIREGGVRFRLHACVVDYPVTADRRADIAVATERLHAVFECWIREYPEQWMWIHRKWV